MTLERIWYEASPYLYAATGVASARDPRASLLMGLSAMLLVVAALTIVALRWIHRRDGRDAALQLDVGRYVQPVTNDVFAAGDRSTTRF